MKRFKILLFGLMALTLGLVGVQAATSPFHVTVSTVVPNGGTNGAGQFTGAGFPNYTGALSVRKIAIDYTTTTGSLSTERVTLWNSCASSTTATEIWSTVVQSSGTAGAAGFQYQSDIAPRLMPLTSPCFSKGTNDSGGTIKATLFYE